jgi:hypothetical protein
MRYKVRDGCRRKHVIGGRLKELLARSLITLLSHLRVIPGLRDISRWYLY